MKITALLLLAIVMIICADGKHHEKWKAFKSKHKKNYAHPEEEKKRFAKFVAKDQFIEDHNSGKFGNFSFTLAHNFASDLHEEEYEQLLGFKMAPGGRIMPPVEVDEEVTRALPASFDWRSKGVESPVKNQGSCGSCWTFSVTGTLEGVYKLNKNTLLSLSEQQLVSCYKAMNGCGGGDPSWTMKYYVKPNGIALTSTYPYTSGVRGDNGVCNYNPAQRSPVSIASVIQVANSEAALQQAVATYGPISVCMDASGAFAHFSAGNYYCTRQATLNHAVLLVGYTTTSWIVKNSWGPSWGTKGYFNLIKGSRDPNANNCGITQYAWYATLA